MVALSCKAGLSRFEVTESVPSSSGNDGAVNNAQNSLLAFTMFFYNKDIIIKWWDSIAVG